MTPYTKTLIGHLTKVETGSLCARLVEDDEGRLPRISVNGEDDMRAQPGSYVAIIQGDVRILAVITSLTETHEPGGTTSFRTIQLIPLGEIVIVVVNQPQVTRWLISPYRRKGRPPAALVLAVLARPCRHQACS